MKEQGQGGNVGGEYYVKHDVITPDSLAEDNYSSEAESRLLQWEDNRENKRLTLLTTCSDSRIITPHPESSVVVRSIAAGRDLKPFSMLIEHKSIDNVHIMGHHAGNTVIEGNQPRGCGGLGAKEAQKGKTPSTAFEKWVADHIYDSDNLLHAFYKAADVLEFTDKDILLSTQDHLDHTIMPMAGLMQGKIVGPIKYDNFSDYTSEDVYRSGIPIIPSSELEGSPFEKYLATYFGEQLPKLHFSYSEHDRTTQEIQNPKALLLTTNVRPAEILYPNLTRKPNTVFVISLAREKVKDEVHVTEEDIESVLTQAEYPLGHFDKLTTIYIETGNMDQSVSIARALEAKPLFIPWIERKANQILIGETKAGKVQNISKF